MRSFEFRKQRRRKEEDHGKYSSQSVLSIAEVDTILNHRTNNEPDAVDGRRRHFDGR